ncbi:hypothetical protein [Gaopeijia maritima]|uniref:Carboxypeptidase-like regulatory domain-containing protein n=1 Tax=Gaopeijia maritima TaxID=3119007 RepID=A0ABU9EAY8_9BACT
MKRSTLLFSAIAALGLAACGPAQVVVTAQIEVEDPASGQMVTRQLSDMEVWLLPYDRDQVFDSLTAAAADPEPQIPAELSEAQVAIREAQEEWLAAENRWNTLRDTLQKLNTAMEEFLPSETQYRMMFNDYNDLEAQYSQVERNKDQLFARFDSLTKENISRAQGYQMRVDEWAAEAFVDVDAVMTAKIRASGLDAAADTTDANGVASELMVPPGEYWVHARYEEVYSELYWNVPVSVARGEPVTVTLNRSNAQVRPIY